MRQPDPRVEAALGQALARFRRRRLALGCADLLTVGALATLVLGAALRLRLVTDPVLAGVLALALVGLAGAGLVVVLVAAAVARAPRPFLADHVERAHPSLLDRLNTLAWLDAAGILSPFRGRIEAQAGQALSGEALATRFPQRPVWQRWALSLIVVTATVAFLAYVRPWSQLDWGRSATGRPAAEPNLKLPAPEDAAEVEKAWGEVRITEPGRDLKVSKVDVVPLQIEAASSEGLREVRLLTAVGGSPARPQALPGPREPHYAVYKPLLYVDEHRLSDWDLLTYYAAAGTEGGATYASEVYFLEVRPFREDILKLPGGEGGAAYGWLSEMTGLIDRQKHVIRETHRHLSRTYARPDLEKQDRDKLAEAEGDLAEAARHLYARIAARMENQDVAIVLDQLAQAEGRLEAAARALQARDPQAPGLERDALAALVATRKQLQKAVTDNPGAFGDGQGDEEDPGPLADLPGKLKQISEFRDEEKAARELLERAVTEQRRIQEQAGKAQPQERRALADDQERLRREVSDLGASHPNLFQKAERERAAADEAMRRSAEALSDAKADAGAAGRGAVAATEALRDAVRRRAAGQELSQAYELKQMLEAQARALAQVEKEPEAARGEDLAKAAAEGQQATRELKRLVDETPAGDAFGEPLHRALGPARQAARERKLDALSKAEGAEERQKAAGEARGELEQLGRAFDESQPALVRGLRKDDALQEGHEEAFDQALRQLEGLVAEAEAGRQRDGEDARRRRQEVILRLREGALGLYGKDERTARLLVRVEEELSKADLKVDPQKLRKLLDEIEQFRLEMSDRRLARAKEQGLRHIDPSKLPPAYRERIQRYFEKLAEQP